MGFPIPGALTFAFTRNPQTWSILMAVACFQRGVFRDQDSAKDWTSVPDPRERNSDTHFEQTQRTCGAAHRRAHFITFSLSALLSSVSRQQRAWRPSFGYLYAIYDDGGREMLASSKAPAALLERPRQPACFCRMAARPQASHSSRVLGLASFFESRHRRRRQNMSPSNHQ